MGENRRITTACNSMLGLYGLILDVRFDASNDSHGSKGSELAGPIQRFVNKVI